MTNINWKSKKGFTLVELMLAIVVGGIILGVVGTYLTNAYVQALREERKASLNSNAKAVLEKIVQDIRSSEEVHIYKDDLSIISVAKSIDPTAEGSVIQCKRKKGDSTSIWYRISTTGTKRLLKFDNADASLDSVDQNTAVASDNIESLKVYMKPTASNVTHYNIQLVLSTGLGINEVTATVETECIKYKAP